jgi:hypothetical protein
MCQTQPSHERSEASRGKLLTGSAGPVAVMNWLVSSRVTARDKDRTRGAWGLRCIPFSNGLRPVVRSFRRGTPRSETNHYLGTAKRKNIYQSLEINHELVGRTASNTASKASLHSLAE